MEEQTLQHQPAKSKHRSHIEYDSLQHNQQRRYYKPIVHHTAALCFILLVALGLIALIEYSLHVLPQHQLNPGKTYGQARKRDLEIQVPFGLRHEPLSGGVDIPMPNPASTTTVTPGSGTLPSAPSPNFEALSSPTPVHTLNRRTNNFCAPALVQLHVEEMQVYASHSGAAALSNKTMSLALVTVLTKQYFITQLPFKSSTGYNTPLKPTFAIGFTRLRPLDIPTSRPILQKRQVNTCVNSTITQPPITSSSSVVVDTKVETNLPVTLFMGGPGLKGGATPSSEGVDKNGGGGVVISDPTSGDKDTGGSGASQDGVNRNIGSGTGGIADQNDDQGGGVVGAGKNNGGGRGGGGKGGSSDAGNTGGQGGNSNNGGDGGSSNGGNTGGQGGNSNNGGDGGGQGGSGTNGGGKSGGSGGGDGSGPGGANNNGGGSGGSNDQGQRGGAQGSGKSGKGAAAMDSDSGLVLGKPFTTEVDGQQMVMTPILGANALASRPYTTVVDGQNVVVTPGADPFTTMINGVPVVITPTPTSGGRSQPYTTIVDGKEVVVTPRATPYTTTIDGKEVVVTPNADATVASPYTTIIDGKEVVVTPRATPYTTTIDGKEVVVTPNAGSTVASPYTTIINGKEVVVTPRATPYTTTIDGQEVVVTPGADADAGLPYTTTIDGREVVVTPQATPYTTTINGHEVVVTPRPLASKLADSKLETVIASIKGHSKLTTMTISMDRAKASNLAKSGPWNDGDNEMPSSWKNLTFTESSKNLTFIKSPINYFYGVYLPVLLSVIFQMLVYYLYTATKMMEPFAILSSAGQDGIPAKEFLWINYLSANDSLEPFTAMASGHWLMLWVSVLYIAAQAISPLSSEMLGIYPGYKKTSADRVMAGASLWVHPQIARLMQAILILISILIIATWFLLRKYQSRVYSDPSSIEGIAAITHHPTTVRLFSSMDLSAPKEETLESLAGTRYRLGWYPTANTERYGIIATTPSTPSKDPSNTFYAPLPAFPTVISLPLPTPTTPPLNSPLLPPPHHPNRINKPPSQLPLPQQTPHATPPEHILLRPPHNPLRTNPSIHI